ncbi:MAG: DedA family protein [Oscillospiraceae bacterium]|nr:DedA family protein [Oscillospiraceae bacterium]
MQEKVFELIDRFGYAGIGLLIFAENIFPPIPSEATLLLGGYAAQKTDLEPWLVILSATLGSAAGACVLYYIGYIFGSERLKRISSRKFFRLIGFSSAKLDKAEKWFKRYEYKAVAVCRCIPIVRSIVSIPAGISKMPFLPFILLTAAGSTVWNTVLVFTGAAAGDAWENALEYFSIYSEAAAVIFAVLILIAAGVCLFRKKAADKTKVNSLGSDDNHPDVNDKDK